MLMQLLLTLAIVVVIAMDLIGLYGSRKGRSRLHTLAFWTGIAGLLGLIVAMLGAFGLFMQLIMADINSTAGRMFTFGSAVALPCSLVSGGCGWVILRRRFRLAPATMSDASGN